ncbi:MAG: hypothetical protein PHQ87_04545 [Hydrogenophaga sp.]|nr:hypothetical protein [Hydrogenophaga sp.]MDD3784799.1 hypothetical protein [Hydrogenophaga sp.]MDX9968968.1 hypothetical protein [Hydrogenophaga sp.]
MTSRPVRWMLVSVLLATGLAAHAQNKIYRCGSEYTNDPKTARDKDCKLMEGGNITIIQGTTPRPASTPPAAAVAPGAAPRPAAPPPSAEQRARDSDARAILESELRKAQARLAEARAAYADGEPEKQGIESRNYQRYLDRVAELKAAVSRAEADVAGIERELSRLPAAGQSSAVSGAK